jgi:LDH2 family malate/lactate/ureidoglycolate dehydrogenase
MSVTTDRMIPFEALRDLAERLLVAVDVPSDEAALVADTLATADARGMNSHGVMRLPVYVEKVRGGGFKAGKKGRVLRETSSSVLIDAEQGLGAVVMVRAVQEATAKARETGVGIAGVTNSNHYGEGAYYVRHAVEQGMLTLLTSNGAPNMPVWGGLTRMTGPLPLTVGAPVTGREPFLLDIAMGVLARGKILYAAEKGHDVPPGTGVDANGHPTTDPKKIIGGGWILPIGGYKGFGITMVLEILAGVLTGGALGTELRELYGIPDKSQGLGHFALVIDPEAFMSRKEFEDRMVFYLAMIKGSERAPGVDEIIIAGEPEQRRYSERLKTGVPIDAKVLASLETLALELGVDADLGGVPT